MKKTSRVSLLFLTEKYRNRRLIFCGFCAYAEKRTPENIEKWLKTLSCKTIRLDGTKPIQESVELIKSLLLWEKGGTIHSLRELGVDEESK